MKRGQFRWKTGRVTFWDLDPVNEHTPLPDQADNLKEDMAQIEYPSGVLLDVGWFPEFARDGAFVIVVVRPGEFDRPLFRATANTVADFKSVMEKAVEFAVMVD
jgi:hypothetical protein